MSVNSGGREPSRPIGRGHLELQERADVARRAILQPGLNEVVVARELDERRVGDPLGHRSAGLGGNEDVVASM